MPTLFLIMCTFLLTYMHNMCANPLKDKEKILAYWTHSFKEMDPESQKSHEREFAKLLSIVPVRQRLKISEETKEYLRNALIAAAAIGTQADTFQNDELDDHDELAATEAVAGSKHAFYMGPLQEKALTLKEQTKLHRQLSEVQTQLEKWVGLKPNPSAVVGMAEKFSNGSLEYFFFNVLSRTIDAIELQHPLPIAMKHVAFKLKRNSPETSPQRPLRASFFTLESSEDCILETRELLKKAYSLTLLKEEPQQKSYLFMETLAAGHHSRYFSDTNNLSLEDERRLWSEAEDAPFTLDMLGWPLVENLGEWAKLFMITMHLLVADLLPAQQLASWQAPLDKEAVFKAHFDFLKIKDEDAHATLDARAKERGILPGSMESD